MKKIFKYPLAMEDVQTINIPLYGKLLSVMEQRGALVVYAIVEQEPNPSEQIKIFIRGTGHPVGEAENANYLGTVQTTTGFVWHVFYSR